MDKMMLLQRFKTKQISPLTSNTNLFFIKKKDINVD